MKYLQKIASTLLIITTLFAFVPMPASASVGIIIECWGGGGGGAAAGNDNTGGTGGGGGAFAQVNSYAIASGQVYTLVVGGGGSGGVVGVSNGQAGGASTFTAPGSVLVCGGDPGAVTGNGAASSPSTPGLAANSTGSFAFSGGAGTQVNTIAFSGGGGGGGGGTTAAGSGGTAASGITTPGVGGTGGVTGGGNGGNGGNLAQGDAGSAPGGGGGGGQGSATGGLRKNGGAGAAGQIIMKIPTSAEVGGTITNPFSHTTVGGYEVYTLTNPGSGTFTPTIAPYNFGLFFGW